MINHSNITTQELHELRLKGFVHLAGNRRLKIYGKMDCQSGKRMKKENRVFFKNKQEAHNAGYRPCGNCMREDFEAWKNGTI